VGTDTSGDLGTILGIWGHPDDEGYLSAGLMARAVTTGHRVVCVTATRGEAGFPADDPRSPQERKALRQSELKACLEILGVSEHHFLGFPDGGCAQVPDEQAVDILAELITEIQPTTVLTFGPDGGTGHPDHIAACRWATSAVDRVAPTDSRLLYSTKTRGWTERFMAGFDAAKVMMVEGLRPETVDPTELAVWFTCDERQLAQKVAAMRAQASQIEPMVELVGLASFGELVREEFFRERRPGDRALLEEHSRR
jgi:LmbE family N-acetylglucosaminyl deacetylase